MKAVVAFVLPVITLGSNWGLDNGVGRTPQMGYVYMYWISYEHPILGL